MKYICAILLFLIALTSYGQRIDAMPVASSANGLEIFHVYQSSQSRRMSVNQVKTFVWDLSPTITTSDTIGFVLVRRTSDGKIFKRSVSSIRNTIEDEGTPVPQRSNINFTGPGVSVADTGGKTIVSISGAGGGSSSSVVLDVETTQVGNVGTGEDVLYTYTLPADTLNTNGEFIRGRFSGILALNDDDKTLRLKVGATTIATRLAANTPSVGQGWTLDWELIRTGPTTQKANATFSGIDGIATAYYSAVGETLSGTVDIVLTGEATSNDDILKHSSVVAFGISTGGAGGGDLSLSDFVTSETPAGAVNGVNTTYTLINTPSFLHLYLDGLLQREGVGNDYTISGPTVTMTSAPLTGSILSASYIK